MKDRDRIASAAALLDQASDRSGLRQSGTASVLCVTLIISGIALNAQEMSAAGAP